MTLGIMFMHGYMESEVHRVMSKQQCDSVVKPEAQLIARSYPHFSCVFLANKTAGTLQAWDECMRQ